MEVFRITTERWSTELSASGFPGRWNSKGKFVIYTSGSRALSALENIVHRSGEGLNKAFKTMVIDIPKSIKVESINIKSLKENWFKYDNYPDTQLIGDQWLTKNQATVLKVPSAIIPNEYNFLINPNGKNFSKIGLKSVEDFRFDPRVAKRW